MTHHIKTDQLSPGNEIWDLKFMVKIYLSALKWCLVCEKPTKNKDFTMYSCCFCFFNFFQYYYANELFRHYVKVYCNNLSHELYCVFRMRISLFDQTQELFIGLKCSATTVTFVSRLIYDDSFWCLWLLCGIVTS